MSGANGVEQLVRCDDIDMKHELKTLPNYFEAIEQGLKKFEIRNNTDRGFQKGDLVVLKEYTNEVRFGSLDGGYTGREIQAEITYVTNYQQQPGYVVFGFTRLDT